MSLELIDLTGQQQFRIIPSTYPTINFFEDLVHPSEMEILWEIENMTNERLRQEAGDIFLVPREDRISGPGSSIIMAAFTHLSKPTRFSDGSFGIYYAAFSKTTAIKETVYHRENFMRATQQPAAELTMRLYEGNILKSFYDIRTHQYTHLHHPEDYTTSQLFGHELKNKNAWGLVYHSVRDHEGTCIAAFRPPAISIPKQISHLKYLWNGSKITEVLDIQPMMKL